MVPTLKARVKMTIRLWRETFGDRRLQRALKKDPLATTLFTKVRTMREVESLLKFGWRLVAQDSSHHTFIGTGVSSSTFLLAHANPTLQGVSL
jgi:predicted RNA binding protein YcfA (HicA-like mRNA interferase family)